MILADFLSEQAALGRKGGQINSFTSAIVTAQEIVTGKTDLAKVPVVAAVKTATRHDNPSLPRHGDVEMWDPSLVLDYWRAHTPTSVKTKRAHAISLLMLAVYCRPSDLAKFSVEHTVIEGDTLRYRIRGPKESRSDRFLTPVQRLEMMPESLDEAAFACPVRALLAYWDSISTMSRDPAATMGIVYSLHPNPAGYIVPVGSECLSNVMKEVMHTAGVPAVFTGGSARSAGSSRALDSGGGIDHVMTRGRWSSRWVFHKFYNRARLRYADQQHPAAASSRRAVLPVEAAGARRAIAQDAPDSDSSYAD